MTERAVVAWSVAIEEEKIEDSSASKAAGK